MSKTVLIIVSVVLVLIVLLITVSLLGNAWFDNKVNKEIRSFFDNRDQKENGSEVIGGKDRITRDDLQDLPASVQRWLENAQVIGKDRVTSVRLQQKGEMRTKADAAWIPLEAQQYFRTEEPGFIWKAKIKAAPFIFLVGRDRYVDGHGDMLIQLQALKTVADSHGEEVDQGTLLRYLAELPWFPTAALSPYITWEEIDAYAAKVTMNYQGVKASAVYQFNDQYEVSYFEAKRYMESAGSYSLETWAGTSYDTKDLNGLRIPTRGEVTWKLKTGDFTWLKWEITEIEYNQPSAY